VAAVVAVVVDVVVEAAAERIAGSPGSSKRALTKQPRFQIRRGCFAYRADHALALFHANHDGMLRREFVCEIEKAPQVPGVNARCSFYLDGDFTATEDKIHIETCLCPPQFYRVIEFEIGPVGSQSQYNFLRRGRLTTMWR
jgi:hypothetical protein